MTLDHTFATDSRAEEVSDLAKEILQDALIDIQVISLRFSENFEIATAKLDAKLIEVSSGNAKKHTIQGVGVGLVDACFDAMIKCFGQDYCSLDTISIVDFRVDTHLERSSNRKSDAKVTVLLRIKSSQEQEYSFSCTSSSISHSSVAVVQASIGFFINAEFAYTRLHHALNDARDRGRHDLVSRFQHQMSTLVHATSYEKLVERLRNRPQ